MSKKTHKSLRLGDRAPRTDGRTDEQTPISFTDFFGRAFAAFLIGTGFGREQIEMLSYLKSQSEAFLNLQCSPIVVSGEPHEVLAACRQSEKLPFILISDTSLGIHEVITGDGSGNSKGVWLFDENGVVQAVVPPMGPKEQIDAALVAKFRLEKELD